MGVDTQAKGVFPGGVYGLGWSYFSCRLVRFGPGGPLRSAPRGIPRSAWSDLFAKVAKLQLELPALESRHHAAEFVPGDLATIDDDHWHSVVLVGIAFDGATQDQAIVAEGGQIVLVVSASRDMARHFGRKLASA